MPIKAATTACLCRHCTSMAESAFHLPSSECTDCCLQQPKPDHHYMSYHQKVISIWSIFIKQGAAPQQPTAGPSSPATIPHRACREPTTGCMLCANPPHGLVQPSCSHAARTQAGWGWLQAWPAAGPWCCCTHWCLMPWRGQPHPALHQGLGRQTAMPLHRGSLTGFRTAHPRQVRCSPVAVLGADMHRSPCTGCT